MATFVLVGGAWIGAWAWQDVTRRLRARGHQVYPLSLTGLAERVHLAGPDVDLDTHVSDVVNLLRYEDLSEVFLVGHSYAGSVVTGVADRVPERLATLAFCDTGPLLDGMRMLDLGGPDIENDVQDGWRWPFPGFDGLSASLKGLGERERELMLGKVTAHPFGTYRQPLRLTHAGTVSYRQVMILCDDGKRLLAMARQERAAFPVLSGISEERGWELRELDTGHWPMLSAPAELASMLDGLAT